MLINADAIHLTFANFALLEFRSVFQITQGNVVQYCHLNIRA